jgi:hypothetical protein
MGGYGGGGGNNPLFEPFYDSMRIAVPLVTQQRQLEAAKEQQDRVFLAHKQELLQKAEQASKEIEVKTLMEAYKGASEGMVPEDPASVMRVRATAGALEAAIGKPIFPRDEVGEIVAAPWAKQTKPVAEKGFGSSPLGIYSKDSGAIVQPAPAGGTSGGMTEYQSETLKLRRQALADSQNNKSAPTPKPMTESQSATADLKQKQFDTKQQIALAKATVIKDSSIADLDELEGAVDDVFNQKGLPSAVGYSARVPVTILQDTTDAEVAIEQLKSKTGLTTLANLKKTSGAGLGSVTEAEHKLLQSYIAALDRKQSLESFKSNLQKIKDHVAGVKARIQKEFDMQPGNEKEPSKQGAGAADAYLKKWGQ